MEIQKFAKLTKAAKKTLEDLLNSYVEKELTIEACMEQSQAKATDIIAKAKCIEQAAILRSKEVLEKAECDSTAARAQMDKDKEDWENEKKSIARTHHFENNDIKLDIGGLCFSTSLTTLTRFPDTMIGAMFSGRHYLKKNDAGAFFIDRDGTHFRHILNFLRSPENYMLTLESNLKEELEGEAEFYGLKDRMFPARFYPAQHMQYPPHGWGGNQHIRSMIIDALKHENFHPEVGINKDQLHRSIFQKGTDITLRAMVELCSTMIDDGMIYTSIENSHYLLA